MRTVPGIGELLSIEEAAAQIGVHTNTVRNWIRNGCRGRRLAAHRVGNAYGISPESIAAFMAPAGQTPIPKTPKPSPESLTILRKFGFDI